MRCVVCGQGTAKAAEVELRREVAGHLFTAIVPGLQCDTCGETYTEGTDGERFDVAIAVELATSEPSGEAFRFLRKLAGLSGPELAGLLGVEEDVISQWEAGERVIDRRLFALLGLLIRDQVEGSTATLDALCAVSKPKPLAKRVTLKLAS